MTRGGGQDESRGSGEGADRPQDPIVERGRPDPAQPPERTLTLTGFLGDSDRAGFRRLYFTRDLDYYAEFRAEDVVHVAPIPADEQPFGGEDATRVSLRRDATVDYTRTRTARPLDEFDIDVRFGGRVRRDVACAHTDCDFGTCYTCATRCFGTCDTCDTQCNQATCVTCPTCATCRGDTCPAITCDTCPRTVCECRPTVLNPPCPPRVFTDVC
jgi:hypothetical protein